MRRGALALALLPLLAAAAHADPLEVGGLADFRLFDRPDEPSWVQGGLDKLQYDGQGGTTAQVHELAATADWHVPDWAAHLVARYAPDQRTSFDVTEGYVRYRPVSITPLQWSVKAGAFYPPISLENTGIAWSTPWTLTPSAINSWVGEELRTIGSEGSLQWRGETVRLTASAALFGVNEPAGALLSDRGWGFGDLGSGLFGRDRLPDALAGPGFPGPLYESPYEQVDGRVGWYQSLDLEAPGIGEITALRYDNNVNPAAHNSADWGWKTDFWSLGGQTQLGNVVLMAQGMAGETAIQPPGLYIYTDFQAAYLLAGYDLGDWHGGWRVAARADLFATQNESSADSFPSESEHGHAATLALTWRPADWSRVTAEFIRIDDWRLQRTLVGLPPRERDDQAQLGVKFFY